MRHSRELCGCNCRFFCQPDTCSCARDGIKCQVLVSPKFCRVLQCSLVYRVYAYEAEGTTRTLRNANTAFLQIFSTFHSSWSTSWFFFFALSRVPYWHIILEHCFYMRVIFFTRTFLCKFRNAQAFAQVSLSPRKASQAVPRRYTAKHHMKNHCLTLFVIINPFPLVFAHFRIFPLRTQYIIYWEYTTHHTSADTTSIVSKKMRT